MLIGSKTFDKGQENNIKPYTPWKINMEPTNHPFRKEHDLPNLQDYVPCQSSGVYDPPMV